MRCHVRWREGNIPWQNAPKGTPSTSSEPRKSRYLSSPREPKNQAVPKPAPCGPKKPPVAICLLSRMWGGGGIWNWSVWPKPTTHLMSKLALSFPSYQWIALLTPLGCIGFPPKAANGHESKTLPQMLVSPQPSCSRQLAPCLADLRHGC